MIHPFFYSTSTQTHNVGPQGYVEKLGMERICNALRAIVDQDGRFKMHHSSHAYQNTLAAVGAANAIRPMPEFYLAGHSNAGMQGTIVFYHSLSARGQKLATILLKHLASLSPGKEAGIRVQQHDSFYELNATRMPAVLIEYEAHDWLTGVLFLVKAKPIARAVYKAICEYVGVPYRKDLVGEVVVDPTIIPLKKALAAYATRNKIAFTAPSLTVPVMGPTAVALLEAVLAKLKPAGPVE